MKSLILTSIFVFLVLCCANHVSSRPLNQNDVEIDEEIIFPATTTTLPSAAAITSPPSSTPTTDPTMIETTPSAVSELLAAIFCQTIYTRIESLLLDPGKRSEEKQKIVDSAVSNYHRQKMFDDDDNDATDADDGDKVENVTREESDISKSTGWFYAYFAICLRLPVL